MLGVSLPQFKNKNKKYSFGNCKRLPILRVTRPLTQADVDAVKNIRFLPVGLWTHLRSARICGWSQRHRSTKRRFFLRTETTVGERVRDCRLGASMKSTWHSTGVNTKQFHNSKIGSLYSPQCTRREIQLRIPIQNENFDGIFIKVFARRRSIQVVSCTSAV